MKKVIVATLLVLSMVSCGGDDSPTAPTSCTLGPYSFDANVNRCRASNGQFAADACCGR
jgi:hypothetical protein